MVIRGALIGPAGGLVEFPFRTFTEAPTVEKQIKITLGGRAREIRPPFRSARFWEASIGGDQGLTPGEVANLRRVAESHEPLLMVSEHARITNLFTPAQARLEGVTGWTVAQNPYGWGPVRAAGSGAFTLGDVTVTPGLVLAFKQPTNATSGLIRFLGKSKASLSTLPLTIAAGVASASLTVPASTQFLRVELTGATIAGCPVLAENADSWREGAGVSQVIIGDMTFNQPWAVSNPFLQTSFRIWEDR